MEESFNSLDGWVAFKSNPFKTESVGERSRVVFVAWNSDEQAFAVTVTNGHRKASDRQTDARAACIRYTSLLLPSSRIH